MAGFERLDDGRKPGAEIGIDDHGCVIGGRHHDGFRTHDDSYHRTTGPDE